MKRVSLVILSLMILGGIMPVWVAAQTAPTLKFKPPYRGGSDLTAAGGGGRLRGADSFKLPSRSRPPIAPPSAPIEPSRGGSETSPAPPSLPQPAPSPTTASSKSCITGSAPLAALVPAGNLGLVVGDRPMLFVNVPQTTAKIASLSLEDANGKLLAETIVDLPETPGILRLELPETIKSLDLNQNYRWHFSLICDERSLDRSPQNTRQVEGWIRRVEPKEDFVNQLDATEQRVHVILYAEAGFWYDMLATLHELRLVQPENAALTDDWTSVLNSVGLEQVATQPLLEAVP